MPTSVIGAGHSTTSRPCVLTVFPHREARDLVREVCAARVPSPRVLDAASPTDAVMTLLSTDVDLVLVDVDGAGELLAALTRHVQRSAPDATLVGFSAGCWRRPRSEEQEMPDATEASGHARPWNELPGTLSRWLQQWQLHRVDG